MSQRIDSQQPTVEYSQYSPASMSTHNNFVILLSGSRGLNKRTSLFIEGLLKQQTGVRVLSLPRGKWNLSRFEHPVEPSSSGRFAVQWQVKRRPLLTAVFCFHWIMLPLAILIGLLRRVPVVYDEHDHYELNAHERDGWPITNWFNTRLIRAIHATCLPLVDLVTCIHLANSMLKSHLQKWQSAVLELHNYPVAAWSCDVRLHSETLPLCFVYMGGVYEEKGVGAAAAAFCSLPQDVRRNSEFHVFGNGDQQLMQQLQQKSGIILHDSVSPAELRDFVGAHRCCGLVLYREHPRYQLIGSNSRKLYEYLAIGMPVICTSVGELPEFILQHHVGLVINPKLDPAELRDAMAEMLMSSEQFQRMSGNAIRLMKQPEMTWENEWNKVTAAGVLTKRNSVCVRPAEWQQSGWTGVSSTHG